MEKSVKMKADNLVTNNVTLAKTAVYESRSKKTSVKIYFSHCKVFR